MPAPWQDRVAEKRAAQLALIPAHLRLQQPFNDDDVRDFDFSPFLSRRQMEITNVESVTVLLDKLAKAEWSAVDVLEAFSRRALVAHQLVNCLTEIFVEEGLERARQLDEHLARTGKTVGPLHGLPVSLKDQIDVKGQTMTMGYVGWLDRTSEENAVVADLLLQQGAVLYVRTNVPQSLMVGEAVNNLFGTTSNPANRKLTSGGSSGGEGALIAMRGSILGVGSDIGGSIRIPSGFNGLYGLRPSYNRVPYAGSTNSMEGLEAVYSVLGPMTASVDGLKIFMKAIADAKPWLRDPLALRLPFSESEYALEHHGGGKQLCFAIMVDDGNVKPMPPCLRALETVRQAVEAAGHKTIIWKPYETKQGYEVLGAIFNADGGHDVNLACATSGEPRIESALNPDAKHLSTYEYWQVARQKQLFIKKHLDHWEATKKETGTGRPVDAILAPVGAGPAQLHRQFQYIYYTGLCNLCDYSTGVVPVTRVDPVIDVKPSPHEFRSEDDQKIYNFYDPEVMKNAPVGVQIIGRKNEEEAVIRMTEIVDAALKAQPSSL
ncbi:hypothetical protein OIO90_005557 [Microbotryomycetes sp. JL221]|nr:hypothetical protein OIO90_005557 [Microbotryomycetes sp. JL221]